MKRVKVILSSLAVVAIVSGALAFTAQKGQQKICFNTTDFDVDPNATTCTSSALDVNLVNAGSGNDIHYTIVAPATNCNSVTCPNPAQTFAAE